MLVWVIYDISDNALRTKVSEKCKDYGMERLQKSAYLGNLNLNIAEMLAIEIEDILKDKASEEDCVFILPMCDSCIKKKITIGKGFDEAEFKEKFFVIFKG
jgi:CRISPR-associated protein Cas2